jgi:hypothetical protein
MTMNRGTPTGGPRTVADERQHDAVQVDHDEIAGQGQRGQLSYDTVTAGEGRRAEANTIFCR